MAPAPQPRPDALSVGKYMLKARESMQFSDDADSLQFIRFGYFGEIGGLLSAVKKAGRDSLKAADSQLAAEELGDALWYLTIAAHLLKITADALGAQCILVLRQEFGESKKAPAPPITFRQIDGLIESQRDEDTIPRPTQLGKLALSAGVLAEMSHASLDAMAAPSREAYFGKLLSELAKTCASFNLSLEDIAQGNLEKTASRWPSTKTRDFPLFDDGFPEHEQFEREFTIEFIERGEGQNRHVVQRLNGVYIGDRLTDNSNESDDYRFHDVFHLAYVAHLGWSPVLRSLLKRKRKPTPPRTRTMTAHVQPSSRKALPPGFSTTPRSTAITKELSPAASTTVYSNRSRAWSRATRLSNASCGSGSLPFSTASRCSANCAHIVEAPSW